MAQIDKAPIEYMNRWISNLVDIINDSFTQIGVEVPALITLNKSDPAPTEDMSRWYDNLNEKLEELEDKVDQLNDRLTKLKG